MVFRPYPASADPPGVADGQDLSDPGVRWVEVASRVVGPTGPRLGRWQQVVLVALAEHAAVGLRSVMDSTAAQSIRLIRNRARPAPVVRAASLVFARAFGRDDRWRPLRTYSIVTGLFGFALLVLYVIASAGAWNGLAQRTFVSVLFLWIAVVGFRLSRVQSSRLALVEPVGFRWCRTRGVRVARKVDGNLSSRWYHRCCADSPRRPARRQSIWRRGARVAGKGVFCLLDDPG